MRSMERLMRIVRCRQLLWHRRLAHWADELRDAQAAYETLSSVSPPSTVPAAALWYAHDSVRRDRLQELSRRALRAASGVRASRLGVIRAQALSRAVGRRRIRLAMRGASAAEMMQRMDLEAAACARVAGNAYHRHVSASRHQWASELHSARDTSYQRE